MSQLFLDRFDNARKTVWSKLSALHPPFVLAGGTAIMLQIGHRESYDFDCFTQRELPASLYRTAARIFGRNTQKKMETPDMLTVVTPQSVEITFIAYPYVPLRPPIATGSLPLFHLDDLAANKAHTLGRRNVWRDYVDLFFLMKWGYYDLRAIITLAEKKYGSEFNSRLFTGQLGYFDDVSIVPTVFLKESDIPEEIKSYLEKQVTAYLKTVLPI